MSDKDKINEDAVRAQLDAALENMASDPEPVLDDAPAAPSGEEAGKQAKGGKKGRGPKGDPHLHSLFLDLSDILLMQIEHVLRGSSDEVDPSDMT